MGNELSLEEVSEWIATMLFLTCVGCGDCPDCADERKQLKGMYEVLRKCPAFYFELRFNIRLTGLHDEFVNRIVAFLDLLLEGIVGKEKAAKLIEEYATMGPLTLIIHDKELSSIELVDSDSTYFDKDIEGAIMAPMAEA
jgi:hypothetical protein